MSDTERKHLTETWPERLLVMASGDCFNSRVLDAETGVSLANTVRVDLAIGVEGYINATVTAFRFNEAGEIVVKDDNSGCETFTRSFVVAVENHFVCTLEPVPETEPTT
jgi:organic hydroperoxide reductase OsmC/OhrA